MCPNKPFKKKSKAKENAVAVTELAVKNVSNACCVPKGQVSCGNPEISNSSSAIQFRCSNSECTESGLMHQKCYDKFENLLVLYLGRHTRCRDWSQSKKQRSLWQDFSYDLIFKLCECECGHGYIKREGANPERVEGAAAVQTYQEKKKKKANLKPKINYPMDKVSEKSVGTFTSHLNNNLKKVKGSKPSKGKSANYNVDGFDSDTTSDSIPRLNPPLPTFNLSGISIKKLKSKVKKAKPSKLSDSKVDYEVVERYEEVSRSPTYIEQGNRRADYGDGDSELGNTVEDSSSTNGYLQTAFEFDYVYYSDDNIDVSGNDIRCLEQKCSVEENTKSYIDGLQVYDPTVDMGAVNKNENAWCEYSDKNVTDLRNKVARKQDLEEVVAERNKLQEKVSFLQGYNVELSDIVAAREAEFASQLDELHAACYSEVTEKLKVLKQNEYLKNFNQWLQNSRGEAFTLVEANEVALEQQMKYCCEVIEAHDKAMLNRLENDKVKVLDNIQNLEGRVENLSNLVLFLKNKMEKLSEKNSTLTLCLSDEKKIVTELKEQLLKERLDHRNELKSPLESTLNSQQLFTVEDDDVEDEKVDILSQSTKSVTSMTCSNSEKAFKKQCSELEANNTEKWLDLLEASFKSIDVRSLMIEEKLSLQESASKKDGDEESNKWIKDKILDLTKEYCELQKTSSKMLQNIDKSEELIQGLNCSVNQQIEENIKMRQDVERLEKKMEAFEEEKSISRSTSQVWDACNWL